MAWPSFNLGRFSPFSAYGQQRQVPISNDDFSYITAEDLDNHRASTSHAREPSYSRSHAQDGHYHRHSSSASPDILVLRHKKTAYPLHFSAQSIMGGHLTIGELRHRAAQALPDVNGDARRVRLFFRGKNLKDDSVAIRDTELRADDEVLCVVGDPIRGDDDDNEDEDSDSTDNQGAYAGDQTVASGSSGRKRNRKSRNRKKRSGRGAGGGHSDEGSDSTGYTGSSIRAEHLPTPSTLRPSPHTNPATARPVTPTSKPATPTTQTPLAKLTALSDTYLGLVSRCETFIAKPPSELKERDLEHKRLTETILQNVLFKLDAVETEGNDEARTKRKALVKEAQTMLTRLDAVVGK